MSDIGTRRTVVIGGREVPGIQTSESKTETVELPNGRTIRAQFAEILTLRGTNPVNPETGEPQDVQFYVTSSYEQLRFTPLRFTTVEGLDVDEHGAMLNLRQLEERRAKDIAARQVARAANAGPTILSMEELDIAGTLDAEGA